MTSRSLQARQSSPQGGCSTLRCVYTTTVCHSLAATPRCAHCAAWCLQRCLCMHSNLLEGGITSNRGDRGARNAAPACLRMIPCSTRLASSVALMMRRWGMPHAAATSIPQLPCTKAQWAAVRDHQCRRPHAGLLLAQMAVMWSCCHRSNCTQQRKRSSLSPGRSYGILPPPARPSLHTCFWVGFKVRFNPDPKPLAHLILCCFHSVLGHSSAILQDPATIQASFSASGTRYAALRAVLELA